MNHSKTLEKTKLWEIYSEKLTEDPARVGWTKKICEAACQHLKAVRDTFPNFTLHDGAHVLNVLDCMAGLLGSWIDRLTVSEAELLLLAAALHDIGMIYTLEDEVDSNRLRHYTEELRPKLRGKAWAKWEERDKTDFLRWLHPFRVDAVLEQPEWRKYFEERVEQHINGVPERVIIAVCQAHGETPEWVREQASKENGNLSYLSASEIDPLFCAILLRLADILDFDDSRAPLILFPYAQNNEKSVEEWKKHRGSWGFTFPSDGPNTNDLPYKALFTDANIERAARRFLDWIDTELYRSRSLIHFCNNRWKEFPFPFQVDRREIQSKGYDYGDFRVSMDQEKILELLTGEHLYSDRSVFVRELLQNAIDATLLRAKMDPPFGAKLNSDAARIELWEWTDEQGELWFRIDDNGTGMTRGMLEKYFLKAGNSYYESEELKRDLEGGSFTGISRFGIGFLSCFLCGKDAQLSTLYCKPEKNRLEAEREPGRRIDREKFGLRLDVTGLNGFFTLRNQALRDNRPKPLPTPSPAALHPDPQQEQNGYRTAPGTSIAIRLDPGLLGAKDLQKVAEHWVCYPRMPIYYNGKRIGLTHNELLDIARKEQGILDHELSANDKKCFDKWAPELAGRYPFIRERIELFEGSKFPGLPSMTIILSTMSLVFSVDNYQTDGKTIFLYQDDSTFSNAPLICMECIDGKYNHDLSISPSSDSRMLRYGKLGGQRYSYRGILSNNNAYPYELVEWLILDESEERPEMRLDRSCINDLPLISTAVLEIWANKYNIDSDTFFKSIVTRKARLSLWRNVNTETFRCWVEPENLSAWQAFIKRSTITKNGRINAFALWDYSHLRTSRKTNYDYYVADFQLRHRLTIDYADGQKMEYSEIDSSEVDYRFDYFPPMPFCYGKTEEDRIILCASESRCRFGITVDHPFTEWLLNYAEMLDKHYPRQLQQITKAICVYECDEIINTVNQILDQLAKSAFRYGIDISTCPRLTNKDFWVAKEEETESDTDSCDE